MSPVSAPPLKLMLAPPTTSVKLPVMFGPNITGLVGFGALVGMEGHGAFRTRYVHGDGLRIDSNGLFKTDAIADFNASFSDFVYGSSSTVQPDALRLLPCIKI